MRGKDKCRILKQIRQQIADANDIEYITRECTYQGDCRGTCPKCESELRYLEEQLALRQNRGKKAVIAAVAAGIMLTTATACDFSANNGEEYAGAPPACEPTANTEVAMEPTMGEAPVTDYIDEPMGAPSEEDEIEIEGEPAVEYEEESVLTGDVAYVEPEETK